MNKEDAKRLREVLLNPVFQKAMEEVLADTPLADSDEITNRMHTPEMLAHQYCIASGMQRAFRKLFGKAKLPAKQIQPKPKSLRYDT